MTRLIAFAVGLLCLCNGCVTAALWTKASTPTVPFETIVGSTRPGPGPRQFLVARYGDGADARLVRVPLDADGKPLAPFNGVEASVNSTTSSTTPQTSVANAAVSIEQRAKIEKAAAPSRSGRRDPSKLLPTDGLFLGITASDRLVLATYRLTPDGRVHPYLLPLNADPDHLPGELPKDVHAVLLPARRPMDPARLRVHKMEAAALTPLSVAADATIAGAIVGLIGLEASMDDDFPCGCDDGDDHGRHADHHEDHGGDHEGERHSTHPR